MSGISGRCASLRLAIIGLFVGLFATMGALGILGALSPLTALRSAGRGEAPRGTSLEDG